MEPEQRHVNIPISKLQVPPREFSPRVIGGLNRTYVRRYRETIEAGEGEKLWPIEVWRKEPGKYWIVSGVHRYYAAVEAGLAEIPCVVRDDVTEETFLLEAFVPNLTHGYPYVKDERRKVVRILYGRGFSVKEIHEKTHISKWALYQWVKDLADHRRSMRDAAIMEMARNGLTHEEIARRVGLTRQGVDKILRTEQSANCRLVASDNCETDRTTQQNLESKFVASPPNSSATSTNSCNPNRLDENIDCVTENQRVNIYSTFVNPEDSGHGSERRNEEAGRTDESPACDHSEILSSSSSENSPDDDGLAKEKHLGGFEDDSTSNEPIATQEDTEEPSERVESEEAQGPESKEDETETLLEDPTPDAENAAYENLQEEVDGGEEPSDTQEDTGLEPEAASAGSGRSREPDSRDLGQIDMFRNLPEEEKKAIEVIYYVAQRKKGARSFDLDDIAERVCADEVSEWAWMQAVVSCAIVLAVGTSAEIDEIGERLGLAPDVVRVIGTFVKMGVCNPIGTGLWDWAKRNLWKTPPEWILELVGFEEEDLWYVLEGREVPSRDKVKGMDDEVLEFTTSTVLGLRSIRDRIRSYLHTKEALLLYLLSVNKMTIVLNEIKDEVLIQMRNARHEGNGDRSVSLSEELLEQFRPFVERVAGIHSKSLPGVSTDELEQDLWIGVITGILGWEPDRSSLKTWVKKMVLWKVKEVKREEYKRLKHETGYPVQGNEPPEGGQKDETA
ncbi:MAG: hypothetical protein DRH12_14845 [Deltaproteobacteria bacterium]|nr:MAG: hypothetical protein DRH12_14845 [Deltaproteobacteria bacterium]